MSIHYIDDQGGLEQLVQTLKSASEIALDLEFDRNRYRYGFNMCLMQIYDGNECYLVDPLSKQLQIETIFPIIEDPSIQKVVFAFGEDLRLFHSLGCFPKNLYDLDVATSLLNFEPASLTNLIKDVLQIEVNSSSQQSNWYKRPLSSQQKEYAADDVLYLLKFKEEIGKRAESHGLKEWIQQENKIFDLLDYSDEDHNNLIKNKDKNDLTMFEWHVYKKLMNFFDAEAKKLNKPVYHLINKKQISELASDPNKINQWTNMRGIYGKLKNEHFKNRLLHLLKEACEEARDLELSTNRKAKDNLSREEYKEMRSRHHEINNLKNKLFQPIQDKIAEEFGRHAKAFILPNRLATEIVAGEAELVPDYKVDLFRRYAHQMDLDISNYL